MSSIYLVIGTRNYPTLADRGNLRDWDERYIFCHFEFVKFQASRKANDNLIISLCKYNQKKNEILSFKNAHLVSNFDMKHFVASLINFLFNFDSNIPQGSRKKAIP